MSFKRQPFRWFISKRGTTYQAFGLVFTLVPVHIPERIVYLKWWSLR